MKWAPEDRVNAFAARLLAEQPEPPRKVGSVDLLKTDYVLLSLLVLPIVAALGGYFVHYALQFGLVAAAGVAAALSAVAYQNAAAVGALQIGVATSGQVTRVVNAGRGGMITTLKVDGPAGPIETTLVRSSAANVLVEGDTVQVMVDPQTRQVLLVLGLLKPSPLYAPPKG